MHAGKSGESTPAATKGRRRLGHRLTLWSVPDNVTTSTFTIMTTPSAPLRRLRVFFLLAQPPLLFQEGNALSWQFIHTFRDPGLHSVAGPRLTTGVGFSASSL